MSKRMSLAQIIAAGIVLAVLIGVGFWWLSIAPNKQALEYQTQHNDQLQTIVDQLPAAQRRVAEAEQEKQNVTAAWAQYILRKSPPQSLINLAQNRWRLSTQFQTVFVPKLRAALVSHIAASKVRMLKGPGLPGTPDDPNQIVELYFMYPTMPYPVAFFPCGQIQVQGNFNQILAHVQSWNNLPNYIALTDGLVLQGTSPNLTGTYNLWLLVYPRGQYIDAQKVPWNGGGDAGAGGQPGGLVGAGPGGAPGGGPQAATGRMLKGGMSR